MTREQIDALKDFAIWAVNQCWDGYGLDGEDIQDKAEQLGIIVKSTERWNTKKHGEHEFLEDGDEFYVFAKHMRRSKAEA